MTKIDKKYLEDLDVNELSKIEDYELKKIRAKFKLEKDNIKREFYSKQNFNPDAGVNHDQEMKELQESELAEINVYLKSKGLNKVEKKEFLEKI